MKYLKYKQSFSALKILAALALKTLSAAQICVHFKTQRAFNLLKYDDISPADKLQ